MTLIDTPNSIELKTHTTPVAGIRLPKVVSPLLWRLSCRVAQQSRKAKATHTHTRTPSLYYPLTPYSQNMGMVRVVVWLSGVWAFGALSLLARHPTPERDCALYSASYSPSTNNPLL